MVSDRLSRLGLDERKLQELRKPVVDFPGCKVPTNVSFSYPNSSTGERLKNLKMHCSAAPLWATRKSQWKCFPKFCNSYARCPAPASVETVALFVAHLSKSCEYSTVVNYITCIIPLHHHLDLKPPEISRFSIKQALAVVHRSRLELPNTRNAVTFNMLREVQVICTYYQERLVGCSGPRALLRFFNTL